MLSEMCFSQFIKKLVNTLFGNVHPFHVNSFLDCGFTLFIVYLLYIFIVYLLYILKNVSLWSSFIVYVVSLVCK